MVKPLIFFTSSIATKESASKSLPVGWGPTKICKLLLEYGLSHAHYTYLFQTR